MPIQQVQGKPLGKVLAAMFDVRPNVSEEVLKHSSAYVPPTNESGYFDAQRFQSIDETINLAPAKTIPPPRLKTKRKSYPKNDIAMTLPSPTLVGNQFVQSNAMPSVVQTPEELSPPVINNKLEEIEEPLSDSTANVKEDLLGELENIISSPLDVHTELARIGGQIHNLDLRKKPRKIYQRPSVERRPNVSAEVLSTVEERELRNAKDSSRGTGAYVQFSPQKPQPLKPLPQIELVKIDTMVPVYQYDNIIGRMDIRPERNITQEFWQKKHPPTGGSNRAIVPKKKTFNRGSFSSKWMTVLILTPLVAIGAMYYFSKTKANIESNVVQNGKNAVANMMDAKEYLEEFKFSDAANSFTLAHDDFIKTNSTLDKLGASMSWLLKYIPGLNKISSASNMAVAGENVAKVGEDFSTILNDTARIKLNSILTPGAGPSLYDLFKSFNKVAITSKTRIDQTQNLLSNVSEGVLPEDKRQLFDIFKEKLPAISAKLDEAVNFSATLSAMVPEKGSKKYLILFQNNTELRATGGFPGSYAVISFTDGRYNGIKIDDSYNPDGQLKNNIIPPQPLQHITPTWGMRDANWFADFPTSAKKIIQFYHDGSGDSVDGVLTLTPDIIVSMLKITGPIDMPEYGVVLNADNFMEQVQTEVEYNQHKLGDTPKKILIDFFPRFLAKLGTQDSKSLFAIIQIFSDAVKGKHILAYFNDFNAESVVLKNNFAGAVSNQTGDYLQVALTNIKGSKTDAVTESSIKLMTKINDNNFIEHELVITRKHNGGDYGLRFYNLQNPDYIRAYVPENSELESVVGNDVPNFKPLVDYNSGQYKKDVSLQKIESDTTHPQDGVDVFHESGRKVFGFWMILDPKQTKIITVKYKLVDEHKAGDYHLLIQKQSGTGATPLEASFQFPIGIMPTDYSPELQVDGNSLTLKSDLNMDREINIKIK